MTKPKAPYLAIPRRNFLRGAGAAAIVLPFASNRVLAAPTSSPLFTLGVASGDPAHDSVVLWTRIAPEPLELGGGNGNEPLIVNWQVATDPDMTNVVRAGQALAQPGNGFSVRVLADQLPSDSFLYYRFETMGEFSSCGRTRTFPHPLADPGQMRFALTSCQDYQNGYYNAWRDVVEQDVDFVMQCGDYIYEYGPSGDPESPRQHIGPEIMTAEDYRRRYAQYRLDPNLRAAHEAAPFIVTWDDHEVDNNYAALVPEDDQEARAFFYRRRQAYDVYFETMPTRVNLADFNVTSPFLSFRRTDRLYRRLDFGQLASIMVLDTRQYRDDQPCGDGLQFCPEAADPDRTMLGPMQEQFLLDSLLIGNPRWRVIEQQVMFMRWDLGTLLGVPGVYNVDAWDGYSAQRDRITAQMAALPDSNNIVLTGDIHSSWAADLKTDFGDPSAPVVGAEFVCAGVSSGFGDDNAALVDVTLPSNPHIRYFNGLKRGYALCTVTNSEWRTDFRLVDDNRVDGSAVQTASSWKVVNGVPGVTPA